MKSLKKIFFSVPVAVFLVVIVIIMRFYVFPVLSNYPENIPDILLFYSAETLKNIVFNYTQSDVIDYINTAILFDFIFPVLYGLMLFVLFSLLIKKLNFTLKFLEYLKFAVFIPVLLDFLENFVMFYILRHLPQFNYNLATLLGYITLLKYLLIYSFMLIIGWLVMKLLYINTIRK